MTKRCKCGVVTKPLRDDGVVAGAAIGGTVLDDHRFKKKVLGECSHVHRVPVQKCK